MSAREVVQALKGRWCGSYGTCRCPAHDDRNPSLLVSDGDDGSIRVNCQAGCDWREVKDMLRRDGLLPERGADNGHDRKKKDPPSREVAVRRDAADRADKARRTHQALEIWRRCVPALGTLVETYLRARGITIPVPPSLRYRARLSHAKQRPALPQLCTSMCIDRTYFRATSAT